MTSGIAPLGRRQRAKEEKRRRILAAATALFAERGIGTVTTQHVADRADVAIGTLYLYAATKAELLILVQNRKFAAAIDDGVAAVEADSCDGADVESQLLALLGPVIVCVREQPENGRTYLHELVFGDPTEPQRAEGLALAARLEVELARILERDGRIATGRAGVLARVITAIVHVTVTATLFIGDPADEVLATVQRQIAAILPPASR